MRKIDQSILISNIKQLFMNAAVSLDSKVVHALEEAQKIESFALARSILDKIIENQEIARNEDIPICQDTGVAVVFLEIGTEVFLDYDIEAAVNEGVRQAYFEGYLRKSVVNHPLERKNTLDNTPAIVHIKQIPGDRLIIHAAPKGAGSENMSRLAMLPPSAGVKGIESFVLETVKLAGGKACPPLILGIGIGGNFEKVAILAKTALFRSLDDVAENQTDRELEKSIKELVNSSDVGPMGLGGATTCLAVKVNSYPCHIASLPVAVNIQCHAARKKTVIL